MATINTASSTARLRPTQTGDGGGTGRGSTFILRKALDPRSSGGIMGALLEAGTGAATGRGAAGGATGWGRAGAAAGGATGGGAATGRGGGAGGAAAAFSPAA